MGKRLSKIYTRTGDAGETGLGDGSRLAKTSPRVEAMGCVDELNSVIGLLVETLKAEPTAKILKVESADRLYRVSEQQEPYDLSGQARKVDGLEFIADFLRTVQHRIFDIGGEISIPGYAIITDDHVAQLETALDALNEHLPPLENFILPGGSRLVAECHHARAVCRRAERRLVQVAASETINQPGLSYLNRLSDYLFVVARSCARITGVDEVLWEQG